MPVRYTFGRMSDAQVLRLMDDLMSRYKVASASVSVGDLASFNLSLSEEEGLLESEREPFRNLLTDDTYFVTSMN